MFLLRNPLVALRFGLVFVTWGVITWSYFSFSHFVHHHHFSFGNHTTNHTANHSAFPDHNQTGHGHNESMQHGKGGPFDRFHEEEDDCFLYGMALPLLLLTLAALIWNPSSSSSNYTKNKTSLIHQSTQEQEKNSAGEVNVTKWTLIWFVMPLFLIVLEGARGHHVFASHDSHGWNLYVRICMSLMSVSGYAATWSLAFFLIPVTKHSPILDWLRVTPVQALAFHRISGWVGFWNSVLHGFLHLRHLMDVLNPHHVRPWQKQLQILLIPSSWECLATQNPIQGIFVFGTPKQLDDPVADRQCWLALVNATGMISCLAYLALALTSLPQVRRYSYRLFYRVHIPAAWIMLLNAIWHYPTCILILIPNIIYYLSFHIPVLMKQSMDYYSKNIRTTGPLLEAHLIQGGSIELVFAVDPQDQRRHENLFVKLSHPSVSPLSHPFSVFSRQELVPGDEGTHTASILLRPSGPFTQGLTKLLFPGKHGDEDDSSDQHIQNTAHDEATLVSPPDSHKLQFDSFYASSFDWVEHAMTTHDEVLVVAGGVGITPFLEFLPALKKRIEADSSILNNDHELALSNGEYAAVRNNEETLLNKVGPNHIHVHWYCREVGLASHVWHSFLGRHVQAWEDSVVCQGRLKIHVHLTKATTDGTTATHMTIPRVKVVEKAIFSSPDSSRCAVRPVKDAQFTQSLWMALALPGTLMIVGTTIHWIWYKEIVMNDKFRDNNLVLRSHSILFTVVFGIVVSLGMEHFVRRREAAAMAMHQATTNASVDEVLPANEATTQSTTTTPLSSQERDDDEAECASSPDLVVVQAGRPEMNHVIESALLAVRPGVYFCGPHGLMENVEQSIRSKRSDCAFYQEDSEM